MKSSQSSTISPYEAQVLVLLDWWVTTKRNKILSMLEDADPDQFESASAKSVGFCLMKAWAICQTVLDKADDASPYRGYTEDAKRRKKVLQKFLKDGASEPPAGPLFDVVRQAWSDWEKQQRTARAEQLKQAVRRLSPDDIETAVAEAQVEDVHELYLRPARDRARLRIFPDRR